MRECLCSLVPGEVVVAPAMTLPLLFPHVAHRITGRIVARRSADGVWSMEPTGFCLCNRGGTVTTVVKPQSTSSLPGGVVCKRPWRPPPPESTETLLPTWMGSQWAGTQCHPPATTQGDPPLAWTGDYATSHCCLMCGSRRCHDDCDYSVPSSRQQYTR